MIPISLSGGTVMAVLLMAVIVLGYVAIWAIWHFFFREAGDHVTGERHETLTQEPHDSSIREPRSSADRSCDGSPRDGPEATLQAAQALERLSGDGEASTGYRAGNDAPADGSDVLRVARHSGSSSGDERQP